MQIHLPVLVIVYLKSTSAALRSADQFRDVDVVDAAEAFVNGIETDRFPVRGKAWMQIAARRAVVGRIGVEAADFVCDVLADVVEIKRPAVVFRVGITVGQHPLAVWGESAMAVVVEIFLAEGFHFVGAVREQMILPAVLDAVGIIDDLFVINPTGC